jgi:hypothetical protein
MARETIKKIDEDMRAQRTEDGTAKAIGKRALASRQVLAEALERKLSSYEDLLGKALPDVSDGLGRLRARITAAMLTTEDTK